MDSDPLQNSFSSRLATKNRLRSANSDRWAIILAGGDGTRLRPLTRAIAGDDRPKQFCPILRGETLLDQTRRRVALAIPDQQILLGLTATHKDYYEPLVANVPAERLVVQPSNLGTAPAILYSLLRLSVKHPAATVAFFPSDHYFADDQTFMSHVDSAFTAVKARPEMLVLLGIEADRPEVEYGWIEPAPSIFAPLAGAIRRVQRFWEKPSGNLAKELMDQGFLWNSFVMVGRVDAFLLMIQRAVPNLYQAFQTIASSLGTDEENNAIQTLYAQIEPSNFSQDVLATRAQDLSVISVRNVGWSDWGDPSRVLSTLAGIGMQAEWAQAAS